MKKLMWRVALAAGTVGAVIAGSAAFSAFEAHVVNVTATIANATDISTSALEFGNVFPQEIQHLPVTLSLSQSFLSQDNTGASTVDYMIKQKPKCGLPILELKDVIGAPVQYSKYGLVTEDAQGNFSCADPGYVMLPLLCPYLSKTSPTVGDLSIPAFHGTTTLAAWTDQVSFDTRAIGHLVKGGTQSTTWDIDLHTPCFKGECAQDWAKFVHDANPNVEDPTAYQADPKLEHQQMGCDLWYEVTGITTPTPTPTPSVTPTGTLTVTKVIVNTGGGTATSTDFSFKVDGGSTTAFDADGSNSMSVVAGSHSVTEAPADASYVTTYSNSLNANTNCTDLNVPDGGTVTCTVTNTFVPLAEPTP